MFWIGEKEIENEFTLENKTPLGNELVKLTYTDGSNDVIPRQMKDRLVSLKSRPNEEIYHLRAGIFADLTFSILREYGIKWSEFSYYHALLKTSLEKNREAADKVLYGKSREDITLIDLHEVTKDHKDILDKILNGGA